MSETHSQADRDFLGQVCRYAEAKAVNGVLLELLYSTSVSAPVLLVFAIGDQALALEKIVTGAAIPPDAARIVQAPGGKEFLQ